MLLLNLAHELELHLPELPAAADGLRVVQITDLHISRWWPGRRFRRLAKQLASIEVDLAVFTGDYMNYFGDEANALAVMHDVCAGVRARLGLFGVFGNHDTSRLRERFAALPIHWLRNQMVAIPGMGVVVAGVETEKHRQPDSVALLASLNGGSANGNGNSSNVGSTDGGNGDAAGERPVKLLLSHYPTYLPMAADMGFDVMFAGHTHGGQMRLPGRRVLYNSSDMPLPLSSGILRHRDTVCVVSRGLGETFVPLRVFCPAHVPVITLRRGPLRGVGGHHIENTHPW